MTFKFGRLAVFLLALLLLLTACRKTTQIPLASGTATPVAAATTFESPLATPAATFSAFDSPLPTPTRGPSSKDKAALRGVLGLTSPGLIAPQAGGLYLVPVDTGDAAPMVLPAVDPKTSILAEVDDTTGDFFFDGVGVGLYAFVALTDNGQQLSVRDMETGAATIVTVSEKDLNTVIDLGWQLLP